MSSRFVIMKESALPWRTKKIVLAGELFRRLINTSPVLVERGDARDSIRDFHYKLLLSGYNENERAMIMREGLSRYENIKKQVQEGKRPWYRLASWNKQSRAVRKVVKSKRWYGENEAVFFAEPSPGGMFKESVDKIMKESGFKVKVVEKAGASLESKLQRSDLAGEKRCSDKECAVCSTVDSGGCWKESVGYEMSCEECAENGHRYVYLGETGRTAAIRCREHLDDLSKRRGSLWPHCRDVHGGQPKKFRSKVVGCFRNPLERQLNEAQRISSETGEVLNRKDEWVSPADYCVRIERGAN